jgi:hypothetical protein
MSRTIHLILFFSGFIVIFTAAFALVGGGSLSPLLPDGSTPNLATIEPAVPQPRDPWFDLPNSDPSLDEHIPAIRGIVYSEAIHDMPQPSTGQKPSK